MPRFVVQKHFAKKLHWDLRIELDNVLKSWAIPKQPPLNPGLKRLAILTEDHSLDYLNFEGKIPEGLYGAGKVKIWDKGKFELEESSQKKILVNFNGNKLKGSYCLIRFKPDRWLFFQEIMKKRLRKNLQQLVRTKSLPVKEQKISKLVERKLKRLDVNVEKDRFFNVLATIGHEKPILMLNSHLDTVPAGKGWKSSPFSGKFINGKVYGRGASDNKSGVAAMVEIAKIFKKENDGKLILLFTTREEGKTNGSRKELAKKLKEIKPDAGISLDCASLVNWKTKIFRGCKGIRNFDAFVKGKASHSSEPEKGVNAIYRAMKLVKAVRKSKFQKITEPKMIESFASVTKINTDTQAKTI